jgi:threonine synthase
LSKTASPSIDILLPSNLERFLYMCTDNNSKVITDWFNQHAKEGFFDVGPEVHKRMTDAVETGYCNEENTFKTISDIFDRTQLILDPHTAVGKHVAENSRNGDHTVPMVVAGTAHFSKFPTAVLKALDQSLPDDAPLTSVNDKLHSLESKTSFHRSIQTLGVTKRIHNINCDPDKEAIVGEIRKFLRSRRSQKFAASLKNLQTQVSNIEDALSEDRSKINVQLQQILEKLNKL